MSKRIIKIGLIVAGSWLTYKFIQAQDFKKYLGIPYKWGGSSIKGFDCSGFTQYFYKNEYNKQIPRVSIDQYEASRRVNIPIPGDLIFFADPECSVSHVGIYLGNNYFVHAGSSTGIFKANLDSNNKYWRKKLIGFGRF